MKETFDTLEAFIERAGGKPATAHYQSVENGFKFTGTHSFFEAVAIARDGWKEGRELVEAARAHFEQITGSRVRRLVTVNDVAGFAPDVPAFLTGSPDCMLARETEETEGAGKILKIVVQGVASFAISKMEIMRKGALIVALVDALESAGRSVELVVDFTSGDTAPNRTSASLTAKRAGEPVEIDRLAFVLAHPSMLRRFAFGVFEKNAAFMTWAGSGYGTCGHADDRGDIYIPGSDLRVINDGEATKWIRAKLAEIGITFDAA
jgi:hypothetical protein